MSILRLFSPSPYTHIYIHIHIYAYIHTYTHVVVEWLVMENRPIVGGSEGSPLIGSIWSQLWVRRNWLWKGLSISEREESECKDQGRWVGVSSKQHSQYGPLVRVEQRGWKDQDTGQGRSLRIIELLEWAWTWSQWWTKWTWSQWWTGWTKMWKLIEDTISEVLL